MLLASALVVQVAGCQSPPPVPAPVPLPDSHRTPPAGPITGAAARYGGHMWLGISYGAPPVGEARWRAPRPAPRWSEPLDATHFGPPCPQYATSMGGDTSRPEGAYTGDEDCLSLNVYAPAFANGMLPAGEERLPVMVWIHGGGNTNGTAAFYDGSRLASEQRVLVVTVDYRLGPLGWFRHAALREAADDPRDASGNFGTLDLILALEWLQENVAAFGGNPDNVTIFGESAGGWNVLSLIASPLAEGLFHRAIVQSGLTWSASPARAEHFVDDPSPGAPHSSNETLAWLLIAREEVEDRAAARRRIDQMSAREIRELLRSTPPEALLAAYDRDGDSSFSLPRIFEDGAVLPSQPLAEALAGSEHGGAPLNPVPIILGSNRDEEKLFFLMNPDYVNFVFGIFPLVRHPARHQRDAETITRIWRVMGVDEPARNLTDLLPGQVFAYRFDWDEEPSLLWLDLSTILGAAHGFEIPFVFGHWHLGSAGNRLFDKQNEPGREALSAVMMSYWAEFARHGRPGRGGAGKLPSWQAWGAQEPHFMVFDTPAEGGPRLAAGSETADDIAREILADPSYESSAERCQSLSALVEWAPTAFPESRFEAYANGRCD